MFDNKSRRKALRGVEGRIFDLLSKALTPDEWKQFLTIPLERAAAQGDTGLADKLMEAEAETGFAVHAASEGGHVEIVNNLLENGASLGGKDSRGKTPLHAASIHGKLEVVELLLLKGADRDALDNDERTPLHVAVLHDRVAVVQALLAAGGDPSLQCGVEELSAIQMAALLGYLEVLKALIEHGVDPSASTISGWTALHEAARSNKADAIDMLAEAGSNIEAQDGSPEGRPLHTAADALSLDAALALMRHGAHVNPQARASGLTPLHCAAMMAGKQGAAEMVDALLRAGGDETIKNEVGLTAAERVGKWVQEQDRVVEDFERVCKLFANASADRAWRRRGLFVVCRVHPDRAQLTQESTRMHSGMASTTPNGANLARTAATGGSETWGGSTVSRRNGDEWAVVAATVLELQEEGVFRAIVGYL